MNHRSPPGAEPAGMLALFPSDAAWARTRVLDAQAIDTCDFDLDAFARHRRIRILTCSNMCSVKNPCGGCWTVQKLRMR